MKLFLFSTAIASLLVAQKYWHVHTRSFKGRVYCRTQLVSIRNAMTKETDQPGVPKGWARIIGCYPLMGFRWQNIQQGNRKRNADSERHMNYGIWRSFSLFVRKALLRHTRISEMPETDGKFILEKMSLVLTLSDPEGSRNWRHKLK